MIHDLCDSVIESLAYRMHVGYAQRVSVTGLVVADVVQGTRGRQQASCRISGVQCSNTAASGDRCGEYQDSRNRSGCFDRGRKDTFVQKVE